MTVDPSVALLDFLKSQARRPADGHGPTLAGWEAHVTPELLERLRLVGEGSDRAVTFLYGVGALATGSDPFAVALGSATLLVRGSAPDGLKCSAFGRRLPGWVPLDAWQRQMSPEEAVQRLRSVIRGAFETVRGDPQRS